MIRAATTADAEAIGDLLVAADLARADEAGRRVSACLARSADTCLVAVEAVGVVGAALACFNGFHVFLSHVAVLHAALVERARALGAAGVIVDSRLSSTPFFQRLGYRVPGAVFLIRDV